MEELENDLINRIFERFSRPSLRYIGRCMNIQDYHYFLEVFYPVEYIITHRFHFDNMFQGFATQRGDANQSGELTNDAFRRLFAEVRRTANPAEFRRTATPGNPGILQRIHERIQEDRMSLEDPQSWEELLAQYNVPHVQNIARPTQNIAPPNRYDVPHVQNIAPPNQDDRAIIESLFHLLDFDDSGRLEKHEIEEFFHNISYDNVYNDHTFAYFDINRHGSLSIDEFTRLLIETNEFLISQRHHDFFAVVREIFSPQIVSPETVVTQPIDRRDADFIRQLPETVVTQPIDRRDAIFISQLPSPTDQVPGTTYTFRRLARAFSLREGATISNDNACGVHDHTRVLINPRVGIEMLIAFNNRMMNRDVRTNVQQINNHMMNRDVRTNFQQILTHAPTAREVTYLENFIRTSLNNYSLRSENPTYQNQQLRMSFFDGIINAIHDYLIHSTTLYMGNDVPFSIYSALSLVFTFLDYQSQAFQTAWSDLFIRENIEAYMYLDGIPMENYNGRNHISCAKGIAERGFLYISSVLSYAHPALLPGETDPNDQEDEFLLTAEELESRLIGRRETMLRSWLQEYSDEHVEDGTTQGLRIFINERISERNGDNNPNDWIDLINALVDSEGVRMMFGGGARKYPRRINIFNALFGKKQRKSLKRTSKTKYTKKNKEKMGKTKRMRKYKKKITQHELPKPKFTRSVKGKSC